MALIFMDGFDHYVTADLGKKWNTVGASTSVGAFGTNSTNGVRFANDGLSYKLTKSLPSNLATIIVGANVNPPASANFSTGWGFIELRDAGTSQIRLYHAADGTISACRGTTVIGSSAAGALPAGVYSYVEIKSTIHSSTGTVEVRINGRVVINLTGQNTQATANAYVTEVNFSSASNTAATDMDDIYICDTTGTNNDFLGPVSVKTVFPTAEGTNTGWTPLSGTDNALMVDETAQDGDTTYNYTDTLNARDTYVINNITSNGGEVKGVAVNVIARKEGDVVRKIKTTVKSNATYALGAEVTLGTSYALTQTVHNTNPDGSVAWTETTVNAMEAGVDLTA